MKATNFYMKLKLLQQLFLQTQQSFRSSFGTAHPSFNSCSDAATLLSGQKNGPEMLHMILAEAQS